jgi:hypothetical protein
MLFKRVLLTAQAGLPEVSRQGAGLVENVTVVRRTTDVNQTITIADMAGGTIVYTGFTAGRNVTTPTAALMLAACPDMDIGDSFSIRVAVIPAFAATWVAGTGVTLAGRATTPASTTTVIVVTKLSNTTVEWFVM